MKTYTFAVLPGDGVGPEVMEVALKVLKVTSEKFGFNLDYKSADIGGIAIDNHGLAFPDSTKVICKKSDAYTCTLYLHYTYFTFGLYFGC